MTLPIRATPAFLLIPIAVYLFFSLSNLIFRGSNMTKFSLPMQHWGTLMGPSSPGRRQWRDTVCQ